MDKTQLIHLLDPVANAPFFTSRIESVLLSLFENLVPKVGLYLTSIHSDPFGIYLRVKHTESKQKMVWISHLDHPAIVFDTHGVGFPLGSIGGIGLRGAENIKAGIHPVRLYSPSGDLVAISNCEVSDKGFNLKERISLPNEMIGVWDVKTEVSQGIIAMRSADNHIATIAALLALEKLITNQQIIDVTLIVNTVEEVYQLSMTRHMLRGGIPELELMFDDQTTFVVLESMEAKPFLDFKPLSSTIPNYTDGVLLKVNDSGIVYGQLSDAYNHAEAMLYKSLESTGRKFQYTVCAGTTDATSISVFSKFSNIVCLAIPCRNKHNVDAEGNICSEVIADYDVETVIDALVGSFDQSISQLPNLLSVKLKKAKVIDPGILFEASRVRKKLLRNNTPRIVYRFYLANTAKRKALLAMARIT